MSEIIDITINVSDISAQLSQARREQTGFKEDLQSMPDMHEAFGGGIERTLATVDLLEKKIEDYNSSTGTTKDRITQDLLSGVKDVNVSTRMFSQNGSFAVSLAKQMFSGLSAAAQSELNKSTAEIARMITSALSTIKSRSVAGMAREILTSADAQKLFETKIKPGTVSSTEYEKYISALLPNVVPMHLLSEYQTARHGSFNRNNVTPSLGTLIPNSYQSSYKARAYQENRVSEAQSLELLQPEQRNIIKAEIMRNDAAARAARNVSGMTKRNSHNELMLSRNITRGQFEQFRRNLWDDYVVRASGRASDRIDIFDGDLPEEDRRKAYARMSSSSAGKVLQAMRVVDLIDPDDAWGAIQDKRGYERLGKEAARSLEQYEIAKYTFEGVMNGKAPSRILISESPNTRALGMSGTHNLFSDKVVEFSFKGYDKTNPTHVSSVEDLIHGKPISQPGSDKRYIAQNMHGTGEDVVYRLVEESAYNDVMQREIAWMKSEGLISDEPGKGLSGQNYWNNFVPALYDFSSSKNLRRHYDATGKGWTPGSNIEANQQNKDFGIIDMSRLDDDRISKLADGLAWVTSGILPRGSIQGRFALGGKGTIHQVNHRTQGDWALNAGLIHKGERFVLPGPNGDVDLTDLHGMFDVSTVKNMQAYSNFQTSEEQNSAFTKLMRRYSLSSMTTYDDSETRAKGLGSQAAMFMKIPQSMQEAQVKEYQKRMRLLDEEVGIREFIFGAEDNVLGDRLRSNEINIANPLIQYMVSKEKESLQRRALAGEFIDFSDEGMAVNQKVNKNPLTAIVELSELSREDRIAKLRELMAAKGLTKAYTDDEIAGIWGLGGIAGGAVVDFSRMDEQLVALQRSPNGFGQFVYGKNYATQAKDVFNKFGVSAQGVYLSEEDMFTLGDADFDGDGVKTLYGDQATAVKDTAIEHAKLKAKVPNVQQASETMVESMEGVTVFVDSDKQRRLALDDAIAAGMAMGLTSGAGEKAAQFDLSDPAHTDMLLAAIQSDRAYSLATASAKNATRVNLTPQMLATNTLGRKWQFLPSKFSRLFNVTGQDNIDIPDEADIFTASNGLKINMDELRKLQLDRINLPSVNQDSVMMGLRSAVSMGPTGASINQMNAVLEALDKNIGYGALGPNAQNLLKNMRAIKLQTNAGLRGMQTEDEELLLQQQVVAARQEIFKQADNMSIGKTGMVKLADGTEMSRANYVNAALRAANVDIAQNHQEQFGVTKGRLQHKFGDSATEYVSSLQPSAISVQPVNTAAVSSLVETTPTKVNKSRHEEEAAGNQTEQNASNQTESHRRTEQPSKYTDSQPTSSVPDSFANKTSHLMMEYLSKLETDIKDNGMPEDVAATRFARWYTDTIPASEDPFVMSDTDAQRIVQQFISTGKLPSSMKAPNEDNSLSGDGNSLIMRDLDVLRSIEGSRGLYEDLINSMRETSSKWYGMSVKQNEDPESVFYARSLREIKNAELRYQNAMTHGDQKVLGPGTAAGMDLANQQSWMQSNYFAATRAHLTSSGENVFEALRKSVVGTGDEFDKQIAKLNQWTEAVTKLEKQLVAFENARKEREAESKIDETDDKKAIAEQKQRIEEAKKLQSKGIADLLSSNDQDFIDRIAHIDEQVTGKIASPEMKISRTVDVYKKQIEKIKADIQEAFDKGLLSQENYTNRMNEANIVGEYIDNNLQNELTRRQQEEERILLKRTQRQEAQLHRRARRLMRDPYGVRARGLQGRALDGRENRVDQFDVLTATYSEQIDKKTKELGKYAVGSDEYKKAAAEVENLKRQLVDAESAAKKLEGAGGAIGAVMAEVGQRVSNVVSQFGRQMFQKAAQEAKHFVQEYSAAMTEIQMVTMKTDDELAELGSGLIQTAIDMKVPVADVTSAATNLYRQGLSDEDVDVRMEDVLKFAKVANIKSTEASKIITTALSNDLVESSGEAMDALVAQGDAAATSAEEIAKGMQKSAASAKQAGVSYEQLVTMLTIITSKTQLGGNQAGTALQTLMYRLYRVNEGEDFYDENGNRIAANDASKALGQQGVSIYDDNGHPRGAYDIMVDIAKNWESASNISQEMVLNALGAGRQRSNIATLIQGLAEDEGALADKYMGLAEGSEGITDQKYVAYLESLEASLNNVQNSFDQLIASFSVSESAINIQDFISEFIQGLAAAEEATNGLTAVIAALGIAQLAQGAVANPIPTIFASLTGGALYAISKKGNTIQTVKPEPIEKISTRISDSVNDHEYYQRLITESKTLLEKKQLTQIETETLQSNQNALSDRFGTAAMNLDEASESISDIATVLSQAQGLLNQDFQRQFNAHVQTVSESINEEAVATIVEANEIERLASAAMGYNDYEEQYNGYTRNIQDINEPELKREYYQDYMGWLSNGELTLQKFFQERYVPNSKDIDYSDASAIDVQALQISQLFDDLLSTVSFDTFENTGLHGLSDSRIKELLSSNSYGELLSIDSSDPYWRNIFDYNEFDGKNGAEAFEIVQAKYVASVWRYIDQIFKNPNEFNFSDITDESIYAIIEDHVRPAISSLVEAQHVDSVVATYYNRVYDKMPDLSQLTGVNVGNILSEEWRNLTSYYQLGTDAIYENYASDTTKPIWQVADQYGKVYDHLTYAQAETKRQEQASWTDVSEDAYNAAVTNEQSVMKANGEFTPTRMYYVSGLPNAPLMEYEEMMSIASANSEMEATSKADNIIQGLKQNGQRVYFYQNPTTGEVDPAFYNLHSDETAYNRIWQRLYDDYYQHYLDLNLENYGWIDGISSAEFWAPNDEDLDNRMFDYASNRVDKATYTFIPDEPVRMDASGSNEDKTTDASAHFIEALTAGLSAAELEKSGSGANWNDSHMEFIMRNNINSISEFLSILNQTGATDLQAVQTNNTSLAKQLDKALVKDSATQDGYARDEQGNLVVQDAGNIVWAEYLKTLAAETENYSSVATVNRIATATYASGELEAQRRGVPVDETVLNNLSGIIGETLTGKLQRASAQMYAREIDARYLDEVNGETIIRQGEGVNLPDSVQAYLNTLTEEARQTAKYSDYRTWSEGMNLAIAQGMLRPDELEYVQTLISNSKYGFTGLTAGQRVHGANLLMQQIEAGTIGEYIASHDASMIDAYSGGFSGLPEQVSYAQMMEDLKISKVDGNGDILTGENAGFYSLTDLSSIEEGSTAYEAIDAALQKVGLSAEDAKNAVENLNDEIVAAEKPYGKFTDEVQQNSKAWKGNKREIASAFKTLNSTMSEVANNQYYREQYKAGKRDSQTIEAISAMTGFDKEIVKEQPELVADMMDELVAADIETINVKLSEFDQFLAQEDIAVQMPSIVGVGGSVDFAEAISRLSGESAAELQALANILQQMGFTASIVAEQVGESVRYSIMIDQMAGLGAGRKSGGGGGGGSKKSAAQKLLDDQKREQTLWDHRRKMIQYEATRYENAGELTNYATMLKHESKEIERQIDLRQKQLESLKKQQAATKKYSDEWYDLRDAILAAEEAISELINDSEQLTQTIEDLEQQILKLHIDLESTVKTEIETRIQAERDMLDGTVSMQDIILEAIRERYRTEWELMQEDLDKKREALDEEIAQIDERLQRRKDAEDEASKHEELAELKRQLTLVSMDGSRTKDQKQLREKIAELEKDLAWDSAEDEAEMQKDALQEQADAYSDYEETYQEYLDKLLEDANNFSDEVNYVMSMGQEDMLRWLSENVEEFRLSLKETQDQMTQSWTDTFKQMKGIVDTYWAEIAGTLASKETFLEYMKQSSTYKNASDSEKAQQEHTWGQMYDNWISAKKDSDAAKDWEHNDEETSGTTNNSSTTKYAVAFGGYDSSGKWVSGVIVENSEFARDNQLKIRTSGLKNVKKVYGQTSKIPDPGTSAKYRIVSGGSILGSGYSSESAARAAIQDALASLADEPNGQAVWRSAKIEQYAKGGYVDYTGLAMVHGSASKPEAFLSADDTALMRSMLDAWQFVAQRPAISNVDSLLGLGEKGTTFGDVHIEITEASFADDADIEAVARRVGDAFTKELSKNGFRTASFNF